MSDDKKGYPCGHCRGGTMRPTGEERFVPGGITEERYACTHCPHAEWKPCEESHE